MGIGSRLIASAAFATALVASTALVSNSARATTLYDNLSVLSDGADSASGMGPLYDSFSTGGSAFYFNSLTLKLSADNPSDGTFTVSLWSSTTTPIPSPDTVISSSGPISDGSLLTSPGGAVSFTPNILLAANKRYWIELSSTGSVNWDWLYDVSGTGVGGEFFANTYGVFENEQGKYAPYQMEISGTPTPLPASWILMLAGLAGFGLLAAYRHRRNSSAGFAAA